MKIKKTFQILFVFLLFIVACQSLLESDTESEDCPDDNCNTSEPFESEITLNLTLNTENTNIPVIIYRGNITDNNVSDTVYLKNESSEITLPLNRYYSFKAKYINNSDTIYVIDGTQFEKQSYNSCDSVCWRIKGDKVNLRLKI